MQAKGRILQMPGNHFPEGIAAGGRFAGRKPSKADEASIGKPANDFLKQVFCPIPATRFNPRFNRSNYDFLYQSARSYSNLLGSSFDLPPDEKDFTGLFRYFEGLLPHGQHLLLIGEDKKLSFKVWFGDHFLTSEVFFIPIQILNRTEGAFRDILLSFFQHFCMVHHFPKKENLYDYEVIMDSYMEEWYETDNDPKLREFLTAYREGYINDTFSLIYQNPNYSTGELEEVIENYIPKNETEKHLIASIRQGINILKMNKNIFRYAHRPEEDDGNFHDLDYDDGIIEAERLVRFVYSAGDYVSDNYLEYINAESGDIAGEYFPRQSLVLSPETNHLLEADFVECFFTWLAEFIKILYDYE